MDICKKCGSKLVIKQTRKTPEQLKKPYYYTAYYYCNNCQRLYHDEQFKVTNKESHPGLDPESIPLFHIDSRLRGNDKNTYDVEIWTDGACTYNGTERARAAWAFVSGKTERAGRVEGKQTNNIAEGLAIYHGLLWAAEKGYKHIRLHTDSQISINNLQKALHKIKMNSEIFYNIAGVIKDNELRVDFQKVLGHSGDLNNERADKLANTLATQE